MKLSISLFILKLIYFLFVYKIILRLTLINCLIYLFSIIYLTYLSVSLNKSWINIMVKSQKTLETYKTTYVQGKEGSQALVMAQLYVIA